MIERYTRPEMGAIWSQEHKIQQWLEVEIAVCEAWTRRGRIPEDAMVAIRGATCDLERMLEIERETDHDLIAFLRATGETVGDAARFIHLGLTSSDVVDTGLAMQARDAADLLLADLDELIEVVGRKAVEHKDTITIGRSHGMQAEPTTFGLKLAVWYDELRRQRERLAMARDHIAVGQISGAVGTHAHVSLEIEEEVCSDLGLDVELVSTQVIQRDRHAFYLAVLAVIASTMEKMTVEVRHLQRSEVAEAEESFGEGNQGSSAMPHKRNPHESERIAGLSRLVRGYAVVGFENVPLWHERDISHSSAERVIFPDACIVLDFMLHETTEIIDGLVVYPERMLANLNMSGGLIFSQRILLALVDGGMDRQEAYRLVQHHAHAHDDRTFRQRIEADPEIQARVSVDVIEKAFDPWDQLHNVDATFRRLGLIPA
ncbi:MAG: adenylosuccinate lyase [Thermomicrobiales bacterium]|nr:adenylosuccinate lyase [Thermomicrobiales bacterium]